MSTVPGSYLPKNFGDFRETAILERRFETQNGEEEKKKLEKVGKDRTK